MENLYVNIVGERVLGSHRIVKPKLWRSACRICMLILWAEEYLEVIIVKQSMGRSVWRTCMLILWA